MPERKNLAVTGQQELSPPDVVASYKEKLAYGWSQNAYATYRNEWISLPERKIVRDYPLEIGIQMTSACNLQCPMCPYAAVDGKPRGEFIDISLVKKIIDEVAGHIYALKFASFGEQTLHPDLIPAIRYAKTKRIQEVSLITNGSRLSETFSKDLIDAGLDWLLISVDGLKDIYEKIRHPLKFDDIIQKLQFLKKYKQQHNLIKPVIRITAVWPAIRNNAEEFYDTFSPLCDLVAFNPLVDLAATPSNNLVHRDNFACPSLWQRLFIGCDGKALICCNDYAKEIRPGDAKNQSIYEIWHGDGFNRLRKLHCEPNGFLRIRPCDYCFMSLKTEFDEFSIVHGRKIWIENIVGLSQNIKGIE